MKQKKNNESVLFEKLEAIDQSSCFQTLTENSPDIIMRFDKDYRHIYVNSRVEELLGMPPESFLFKTHEEIGFPKHQYEFFDEAIEEVFKSGKDHRVEIDLENGLWLDWVLFPEFDKHGNVETVITSARDISKRKYLELELARNKDTLEDMNVHLIEEIKMRNHEIEELQDATMVALGALAESRDNETGNHIKRTQRYVKLLAEKLMEQGKYRDFLTRKKVDILFKTAALHDIGKVGIPDRILRKPSRLTEEEFEVMKKHTTLGKKAFESARFESTKTPPFIVIAEEIIYAHHERWDGSGYPEGLKGEEIPLSARLMALADVYDALVSKRVYKPCYSSEKAYNIILDGKGKHFDPDVVEAFIELKDEFYAISREYKEKPE